MPATDLLGFRADVPDARVLLGNDPAWPLDERVDRHGVVKIRAERPVEPSTLASVARWFGAFGAHGRGDGLGLRTNGADVLEGHPPPAPDQLHQDAVDGEPAAYSIFHARRIPKPLRMTFVDLAAVAADLPELLRSWAGELSQRPGRPLLAAHPRTGKEIVLPPPRRGGTIEGVSPAQAASMIDELWSCIDVSPHRVQLEVRSNDLLIWDGLATAYAHPPLLHADGVRFLVVPLDPQAPLAKGRP